ncbi:MAG: protein-disulfide reductase DsbD family protein [Planctomycetota bacterium]|nr:protein-disulfide reductase DsbD family protein [Planctomycetota bacterium]
MNAALIALCALVPLALGLVTSQDDSDADAQADGDKLIALELKADHDALQPGATITLGLRCKVERRWHVYWGENSGNSGLPFKATITGPDGYEIGKVRFPWPKRHESPGDIVEYIHEGELYVLADVKVPASAKPGDKVEFAVAASWLVCTEVCVSGSGKTSLSMNVDSKSALANEAIFTAARAKEPRPWSELGRAGATFAGDAAAPKLKFVVAGITDLEFFPYRSSTTTLVGRKVEIGKQGGTLALDFEFEKRNDGDKPETRGVLWVKTDKGETSYLFEKSFKP